MIASAPSWSQGAWSQGQLVVDPVAMHPIVTSASTACHIHCFNMGKNYFLVKHIWRSDHYYWRSRKFSNKQQHISCWQYPLMVCLLMFTHFGSLMPDACIGCQQPGPLNDRSGRSLQSHPLSSCGALFLLEKPVAIFSRKCV